MFNARGIHSLFSMCPGGWKAAESSNRDTLTHALHGKSSEIKGFVCTANNKDCSQLANCQRGRIIKFFQVAAFAAVIEITWIICFSFVHLLVQDR